MAAPKNNQNARKWTEARVLAHLEEIHRIALEPGGMFLGRILASLGLHKNVWSYWQHKFAGHEDILYEMELIKECCEANLFTAAVERRISAPFAIMCLKANYGWREHHRAGIADVTDVTDMKRIMAGIADVTDKKQIIADVTDVTDKKRIMADVTDVTDKKRIIEKAHERRMEVTEYSRAA